MRTAFCHLVKDQESASETGKLPVALKWVAFMRLSQVRATAVSTRLGTFAEKLQVDFEQENQSSTGVWQFNSWMDPKRCNLDGYCSALKKFTKKCTEYKSCCYKTLKIFLLWSHSCYRLECKQTFYSSPHNTERIKIRMCSKITKSYPILFKQACVHIQKCRLTLCTQFQDFSVSRCWRWPLIKIARDQVLWVVSTKIKKAGPGA